ncbi:MAG: oligosaccharide flippase family protein [Anaerolineae bacterium]|nr:oligosaccharide flippase family protein [Anaerolineae bacterium]
MNDSGNKQTIKLAVKGFSWNISGSLIRSIVGFFVNIILARLLGPEPFGIIAIALLIISIGNLVIESGLGSALVQQNEMIKKI